MPKVPTYRCSKCSYKSKDQTKVLKHLRLHNAFSQTKEREEKFPSPNPPSDDEFKVPTSPKSSDIRKPTESNVKKDQSETRLDSPGETKLKSVQSSQPELEVSVPTQPELVPASQSEHVRSIQSSQSASPTKISSSQSPSKLSRSNLSRSRPLDTTALQPGTSPIRKKIKSNISQINSSQTSEKSSVEPNKPSSIQKTDTASMLGHSACSSKPPTEAVPPLTVMQVKRESLEEIRFRYYVERLKIKQETAVVKEEVLDCCHPSQSTDTPAKETGFSAFPEPSSRLSIPTSPSKKRSNVRRSKSIQRKPKSSKRLSNTERAEIFEEEICSDNSYFGEIIPELVSEEHMEDISQEGLAENPDPQKYSEESRSMERAISNGIKEFERFQKKLETGKISCKINKDSLTSLKKGLLENTTSNSPGNILTTTAHVINETQQLLDKTKHSLITLPQNQHCPPEHQPSPPEPHPPPELETRVIPLSQPPLVAPLSVPVTDLLTVNSQSRLDTSNINLMNIPIQVGGMVNQPGPVLSGMVSLPRPMLGGMMNQLGPMIIPVSFQPPPQIHPSLSILPSPVRGTDYSVYQPHPTIASSTASVRPTVLPDPVQHMSDGVSSHRFQDGIYVSRETDSTNSITATKDRTNEGASSSKSESEENRQSVSPDVLTAGFHNFFKTGEDFLGSNSTKFPSKEKTQTDSDKQKPVSNSQPVSTKRSSLIMRPNIQIPEVRSTDSSDSDNYSKIPRMKGGPDIPQTKRILENPKKASKPASRNKDPSQNSTVSFTRSSSSSNDCKAPSSPLFEADGFSISEEVKDIKSMLQDVTKMIANTNSMVARITERVSKLEEKFPRR